MYIKPIWKQQKQNNQPQQATLRSPGHTVLTHKMKTICFKYKTNIVYFKYKKSKELEIQNNTGKLSLQYNQWYAGENS